MRIEKVEGLLIGSDLLGANYVVRITTDTGIVGIGQSGTWGFPDATQKVVEQYATWLVGQDPLRIEYIQQYLYRMRPFRGNIVSGSLSAIDIALWDIKGKALGVSLATLLGGLFFAIGWSLGFSFWENAIFAIGIIVANVPEGLLPTVTLALAMATQRMAGRQALIRHLPAVETLGSTTVICTDKTGTLTENRLQVRKVCFADAQFEPGACHDDDRVGRRRLDRKSTRLNSSHTDISRMPSSA